MWVLHTAKLTNRDKINRSFSYGKREYPGIKGSIKVFRQPGFFFWLGIKFSSSNVNFLTILSNLGMHYYPLCLLHLHH
jgi:hypothetical protein